MKSATQTCKKWSTFLGSKIYSSDDPQISIRICEGWAGSKINTNVKNNNLIRDESQMQTLLTEWAKAGNISYIIYYNII